jgi:D-amino-acid dehydrogenase
VMQLGMGQAKPSVSWQSLGAETSTGFAAPAANGTTQTESFDAVVVCAGVDSPALLKPLGVRAALRPVYGYSISAHIKEPLDAPRSGVMDERYKVSISRLGQRVRVAGSAELGGNASQIARAPIQTLYKVLDDWFPGAAQMRHIQEWKGARPMMPGGVPVIGASAQKGIWLNLGHGSNGWALACGSARLVADQIKQRPAGLEPHAYLPR